MNPVSNVNAQINTINQSQHRDSGRVNNTGISFGGVFEAIKKSFDGIMVVATKDQASEVDFKKHKLEIEKAREFNTDLEEAQDILNQIAKIMEKKSKS